MAMFDRLGIGARLFLAFLGITMLSLSSGIGSWFILRSVSQAQFQVNSVALPAVAVTQRLSDAIARLVATAPTLTAAKNEAIRDKQERELTALVAGIRSNMRNDDFTALDPASARTLSETIDLLIGNLEVQNRLVRNRLALETIFSRRADATISAATSIVDLSETLVSNASAGASAVIAGLYGLIDDPSRHPEAYDALDRLIEQDIFLLDRMSELRLRSSQIGLLTNRLSRAIEYPEVREIGDAFKQHLRVVRRRVSSIDDPVRRKQAGELLAVLEASEGTSPWGESIFSQRSRLIDIGYRLDQLGVANRQLSEDVSNVAQTLLSASERSARLAADQAKGAVDTGLYVLVLSSLAAVIMSGLIVWLYVERSVVRRIADIAKAMRRLTLGDLAADVAETGTHELKDLSDAVRAFRDESIQRRALEIERNRTNEELRRHREELEELVNEQTIQLQREVSLHAEARDKAERASLAKSEFLATMSHEIRTPMTGMLGMVRILSGSALDGQQRNQLSIIARSGRALLGILNNILDYSKLEHGKMGFDGETFSVKDTVAGVVTLMQPAAADKDIDMTLSFGRGIWTSHYGDAGKLRQVVFNLVSNAIKFTPIGRIDIHVSVADLTQQNQTIRVSVTDTGIGVSPQDRNRIFESFTQGDASITRRFGGTGLGLAISRRFVDIMHGSLTVDSAMGAGATFLLSVPLARGQRQRRRKANVVASAKPQRILVVEDDAATQLVAKTFLEQLGYKVDMAPDGLTGIEMASRKLPDLVLLDISLPGIDGVETARRLRQIQPGGLTLPILAMSAHVFRDDPDNGLNGIMNGVLAKPLSPEALQDGIRAAMAGEYAQTGPDFVDPVSFTNDVNKLGPDEMSRLLDIAARTLPPRFAQMRTQCGLGDWQALAKLSHVTFSAASSAGFAKLASTARQIEAAAKAGDESLVREALDMIEVDYDLGMQMARTLLASLATGRQVGVAANR